MPRLAHVTFPAGCKTLPEGFWSAVDVWVHKPHVVNKRLCGVKETDRTEVDAEDVRLLLQEPVSGLCPDLLSFLSPAHTHDGDKPWTCTVRTFVPKVNSYGTSLHKEVVLRGRS